MPHAAWWVGLLQVLLFVAAMVLAVRARAGGPGYADLSYRAGLAAAIMLHPWQSGAAVLCAVGACVCSILYYL